MHERPPLAAHVVELTCRQLLKILKSPFRENRRLVRLRDDREILLESFDLLAGFGVEAAGEILESVAPEFQEILNLSAVRIALDCLHREIEATTNRLELHRIELFLLDEHLLANADLAEVVQQRRVSDLAHLIGREVNVAILSG